jgi:predicted TIM-barrel fold metal-dependent hydrolase
MEGDTEANIGASGGNLLPFVNPKAGRMMMLTRRKFLGTTVGASAALATGAQRALSQSEDKRMIVDAQIHLWRAESEDWKWVPGIKPQLPEPFTIERALLLMDEAGVDRAVVVPPSWTGERNDYGLEAAKRYPNRFAVMGRIPLQNPKSAELLPKWKEQPGVLGVRLIFLGPAATWLSDGTADWFWPAAEKAGLPVMFLAPGKGADMTHVAERHPQLQLIVDHMGMSLSVEAVRAGNFQGIIEDTLVLAKYPNVSVKLSGAPNYSKEPYPYRDINLHIKLLFDAFGPQRCYWGTDITNGFSKATYRQRITHFTEALDFLSKDDKDWVMGRSLLQRLKWA